jgi:hypothetical protein
MRKLLKKQGFVPTTIVTDHLAAYAAAMSDLRLTCLSAATSRGRSTGPDLQAIWMARDLMPASE